MNYCITFDFFVDCIILHRISQFCILLFYLNMLSHCIDLYFCSIVLLYYIAVVGMSCPFITKQNNKPVATMITLQVLFV